LVLVKQRGGMVTMMTTVNGLLISTKIHRILTYIHIHYIHAIRLSELALVFNNHPAHLSRKFKKEIGIPFLQYVSNLRIEKAAQLLLSTEKSVKEISYDVGFTRPEIFSKAFKRHMGSSPTNYRNHILGGFPITSMKSSFIKNPSLRDEIPILDMKLDLYS
ncbi:MAG: AraC family transcriptional regulator, partial [Nitrospira sp.]|nr:AraC family transcriptional regulator [Nitrospira sp.]